MHDPQVQRAYAECAEGYGFRIDACRPHDPQKKGIVEAGVKCVKGNFLPMRRFRDLAISTPKCATGCSRRPGCASTAPSSCERALAHDSPHYRTVKTILAGGHDLAPVSTITAEPYAGRARFARATASLFADDGPTFH